MNVTDAARIAKAESIEALSDIARDVRARMMRAHATDAEIEELEAAIRDKVLWFQCMLLAG